MVKRCETSEEMRKKDQPCLLKTADQMRGNTHKRDRVQESGRLRWILSSEMGHVLVLGSSIWMSLVLKIGQGQYDLRGG